MMLPLIDNGESSGKKKTWKLVFKFRASALGGYWIRQGNMKWNLGLGFKIGLYGLGFFIGTIFGLSL